MPLNPRPSWHEDDGVSLTAELGLRSNSYGVCPCSICFIHALERSLSGFHFVGKVEFYKNTPFSLANVLSLIICL